MAPEGFLDALSVIIQIRDLVLSVLNAHAVWHLGSHLDDAGNLVQDR